MAEYQEYKCIEMWGRMTNSDPGYIKTLQETAALDNAPLGAIFKVVETNVWVRLCDVESLISLEYFARHAPDLFEKYGPDGPVDRVPLFMVRAVGVGIPSHCIEGVARYCAEHRPVGSFLTAVFENDFAEAACRADDKNILALRSYAKFLQLYAPREAWGSKEAVTNWIARGRN